MPLNARLTSSSPAPRPAGPAPAALPDEVAPSAAAPPLLLVDIDGVVSLFGFPPHAPPAGAFHWIDGIPHFLSGTATAHLHALAARFELVWCSGWEERAEEYLPALLGVPRALPFLRFGEAVRRAGGAADGTGANAFACDRSAGDGPAGDRSADTETGAGRVTRGHWKLAAIDTYVGARPVAWIDDCLDERCHAWARARRAPTLLVQTDAAVGITDAHVRTLLEWAPSSPC